MNTDYFKVKKFALILLSSIIAVLGFVTLPVLAQTFNAPFTKEKIVIDGKITEQAWQQAPWYPLDKLMVGVQPSASDFQGRFKVIWDADRLYLHAEIVDDVIFDQHADPLHFYWDDDCLEIFIDEDKSGGEHTNNFNAFAYHIGLDNQVADIGEMGADNQPNFLLLTEHVQSRWQRDSKQPHKMMWEVAIAVYDDSFKELAEPKKSAEHNQPVTLTANKKLGFMLAYCDNDGSEFRESFVGSTDIKAVNGDKNLGYKTADVFDTLLLIK